jgi:hypothetical protein
LHAACVAAEALQDFVACAQGPQCALLGLKQQLLLQLTPRLRKMLLLLGCCTALQQCCCVVVVLPHVIPTAGTRSGSAPNRLKLLR